MTIAAYQKKGFFEENDQMAILKTTLLQLQNEGITRVDNLAKFNKETLQQIADNLRRTSVIIP